MRVSVRALAATVVGFVALIPAARAQDMTTATVGGTTIWVGGGFQYLTLPDIRFVGRGDFFDLVDGGSVTSRQKNSEFSEYGGGGGGGIETAVGHWNGMRLTAGVKGFFTSLENSDHKRCDTDGVDVCVAFDPTGVEGVTSGNSFFVTKAERDVDYWGGQVEFKLGGAQPVHVKPRVYRNDYFIAGADIRGIDQDIRLVNHADEVPGDGLLFTYNETLDTTYYGGYVGFGGEYSFGFIPFVGSALKGVGGIYDRLGLRTFINVRGGLYSAETDYDGRFTIPAISEFDFPGLRTRLSKSTDDLAFIGTVSLETRKQIGPRTSLSLWTDYEYISSVPEVHYVDRLGGELRIGEDDAFATRTMLRLNVGLGAAQLYEEPLK
jgi:hypothetical protein